MDCSPPGFSPGILQARILEWVAIPFSRGSSQSRDRTWVSCIAGRFFTVWATREAPWTEEPGGLQSVESHRVGHDWVTNTTHYCPKGIVETGFYEYINLMSKLSWNSYLNSPFSNWIETEAELFFLLLQIRLYYELLQQLGCQRDMKILCVLPWKAMCLYEYIKMLMSIFHT